MDNLSFTILYLTGIAVIAVSLYGLFSYFINNYDWKDTNPEDDTWLL